MSSSSQTGLDSPHQQPGDFPNSPVAAKPPKQTGRPPHSKTWLPRPTHTPPGIQVQPVWLLGLASRLPGCHPLIHQSPRPLRESHLFPARPLSLCFKCGYSLAGVVPRKSAGPPRRQPQRQILRNRMFHSSTLNHSTSFPLNFQDKPGLDGVGRASRQMTSDTRRLGEPYPGSQPTRPELITRQMTSATARLLQSFISSSSGEAKGPLCQGQQKADPEGNSQLMGAQTWQQMQGASAQALEAGLSQVEWHLSGWSGAPALGKKPPCHPGLPPRWCEPGGWSPRLQMAEEGA